MALEDFVRKYENFGKSVRNTEILRNPSSPIDAYTDARDAVCHHLQENRGINLRVDPVTRAVIEPNREVLHTYSQRMKIERESDLGDYVDTNLTDLIGEVRENRLNDLIFSTKPNSDESYTEITDLHKEYMKYRFPINLFTNAENPRQEKEALSNMNNPELAAESVERIMRDPAVTNEEARRLYTNALFLAYLSSSGAAIQILGRASKKTKDEMLEKLGNRTKAYIEANVRATERAERMGFYQGLYKAATEEDEDDE